MKVCDSVYSYVWRGVFVNNCNTFYFGDPFNIIFDPGLVNYLDTKFEEMKKDGIKPEEIKKAVLTHSHPDHFEAVSHFMGEKIPLAMHKDEIAFFNQEGPRFFSMFGMPFPSIPIELVLEEGVWDLDGGALKVIHTPGHSPGSICVYWEEKKALVCGDLVFQQSVGRVDFPGGDGRKLIESIKKIRSLDIEYLLPGHMDIITGKKNIEKNFEMIERYYFNMM